jgi:hypothetical protein
MNERELLARALARIRDPGRWHGIAASRRGDVGCGGGLDDAGRQVPANSPAAVRWCALGAIKAELGVGEGWPLPAPGSAALTLLEAAAGSPIYLLNDGATHARVVRIFERALRAPRKRIVTIGRGDHGRLLDVTLPTFERYATQHGWEVCVADAWPGVEPVWSKVWRIREAIEDADLVLWLDADCAILDDAPDLADELDADAFQALAHDGRTGLSAALWMVRHEERACAFLADVMALRGCEPAGGEKDQWAVREVLERRRAGTQLLADRWGDNEGACVAPAVVHRGAQGGPATIDQRIERLQRALRNGRKS